LEEGVTMQSQAQGDQECFPTSVCIVLGVEWAKLRPEVERRLSEHFGKPMKWRDARGSDRDTAVEIFFGILPEARPLARAARTHRRSTPRGRIPPLRIPKEGRGILVLYHHTKNPRKSRYFAHAVAFADGVVYDPFYATDMGPEGFAAFYKGWRFDGAIFYVDPVPAFRFIFPGVR
jgi:hypothetical protein